MTNGNTSLGGRGVIESIELGSVMLELDSIKNFDAQTR